MNVLCNLNRTTERILLDEDACLAIGLRTVSEGVVCTASPHIAHGVGVVLLNEEQLALVSSLHARSGHFRYVSAQ